MMINNGAIISLTEKISMIVKETTEDFILETIEPYCSEVAEIKISKEELKRIILKNYGKPKPNTDVLDKIKAIITKWQIDTWTDNLSHECMCEIADIVAESEDKE